MCIYLLSQNHGICNSILGTYIRSKPLTNKLNETKEENDYLFVKVKAFKLTDPHPGLGQHSTVDPSAISADVIAISQPLWRAVFSCHTEHIGCPLGCAVGWLVWVDGEGLVESDGLPGLGLVVDKGLASLLVLESSHSQNPSGR